MPASSLASSAFLLRSVELRKGLVRGHPKTCLPDAEESVEETLQLFNDGLLLLCTVSTAEAGDWRHQLVNVCARRFDRTVTESAVHKATGLLVLQIFFLDDRDKLPFLFLGNKGAPFQHHI